MVTYSFVDHQGLLVTKEVIRVIQAKSVADPSSEQNRTTIVPNMKSQSQTKVLKTVPAVLQRVFI